MRVVEPARLGAPPHLDLFVAPPGADIHGDLVQGRIDARRESLDPCDADPLGGRDDARQDASGGGRKGDARERRVGLEHAARLTVAPGGISPDDTGPCRQRVEGHAALGGAQKVGGTAAGVFENAPSPAGGGEAEGRERHLGGTGERVEPLAVIGTQLLVRGIDLAVVVRFGHERVAHAGPAPAGDPERHDRRRIRREAALEPARRADIEQVVPRLRAGFGERLRILRAIGFETGRVEPPVRLEVRIRLHERFGGRVRNAQAVRRPVAADQALADGLLGRGAKKELLVPRRHIATGGARIRIGDPVAPGLDLGESDGLALDACDDRVRAASWGSRPRRGLGAGRRAAPGGRRILSARESRQRGCGREREQDEKVRATAMRSLC